MTHSPIPSSKHEHRNWLHYLAGAVGGTAVALGVGYLTAEYWLGTPTTEKEVMFRSAGGLLEFLGLATVAAGIHTTRSEFGLSGVAAVIRADVRAATGHARRAVTAKLTATRDAIVSAFRSKPVPVDTSLSMSFEATSHLRADLTVGTDGAAPVTPSVEERVTQLEGSVGSLFKHVHLAEEALDLQDEALRTERTERLEGHRALDNALRSATTGGVQLEVLGLIWLAFGVFFATWSQELAR